MHHSDSQGLAILADEAFRQGDSTRALKLYRQAAEAEERALADLDSGKSKTLGITYVSAASLWYKAKEFVRAQSLAFQGLISNQLPPFAREQLQALLQTVWSEEVMEKSGLKFMGRQLLVSVSGGDVVPGGAPLELIMIKIDEVARIFYRTIEMMLNKPLRKHGPPDADIRDPFRPWLFQAAPGSYQFAVGVERPQQMSMFPGMTTDAEEITRKFLDIVRTGTEDPEGKFLEVVSKEEYRDTFLKLTRNLAPTGKTFERLEIRPAGNDNIAPVVLVPPSRAAINTALREARPKREDGEKKVVQLTGTLRGLQLDHDWLEIDSPDAEKNPIRIREAGDAIDDLVGPMVNHRVIVDVIKSGDRYIFQDIQPEE